MSNVDDLLAELDGILDVDRSRRDGSKYSDAAVGWTPKEDNTGAPEPYGEKRAQRDKNDGLDSLLELTSSTEYTSGTRRSRTTNRTTEYSSARTSSHGCEEEVVLGVSGSLTQNIQCLKCDFKVLRFDRSQWDSDVNYLFFRNYMPNVKKIAVKLRASKYHAAYACQCTWQSVDSRLLVSHGTPASKHGGTASGGAVRWVPAF